MMLNRVSLNTIGLNRIGLNRIGKPSRASSDRPYIDPEVLASLKAVCICYGKSNDDPDRAVVKNLVDPDNPFVISNAAYTEGSGYADKGSPYYGAFVTDGIDDLITSTKTVQEMLGGSNECTVLSMMWNLTSDKYTYNNQIRPYESGFIRSWFVPSSGGKLSISGYTISNINYNANVVQSNVANVDSILGDKADFKKDVSGGKLDGKFSVEGYLLNNGGSSEQSQVAWYWTIIANKVLTTDQINQVIAYFNLDRTLKPDICYDVKKQGLTNNTPDADWYLKDFSGNGRDMQLYNFAKKLGSGIGKYKADYSTWTKKKGVTSTPFGFKITEEFSSNYWVLFLYNTVVPPHKIKVSGIPVGGILIYDGKRTILENGINELPEMEATGATGFIIDPGTTQYSDWIGLSVEQIPDYEGALVFDGVDDYGQFVGDLGLKDYTIAVDRAYVEAKETQVPIISNVVDGSVNTPFLMEHLGRSKILTTPYSFGRYTALPELNINRFISYQSTYKYNGSDIIKGTSTNTGSGLTIGRIGGVASQYGKICLWSLMLFPYSMSEFLIERQLKKHKLGTLYPDMVEFRPIVKSNLPYSSISYSVNPGEYISVDSMVTITVTLPNTSDKLMEVSCNAISDISISGDNGVYEITGKIVKSPQKINLVISSYLTMLNNETLISNETLIKNE